MRNRRAKPKDRKKCFVVHAKFENVEGKLFLESWTGRAYTMPTAIRRATPILFRRGDVTRRRHVLVVLSVQPLTDKEYSARIIKELGQ